MSIQEVLLELEKAIDSIASWKVEPSPGPSSAAYSGKTKDWMIIVMEFGQGRMGTASKIGRSNPCPYDVVKLTPELAGKALEKAKTAK